MWLTRGGQSLISEKLTYQLGESNTPKTGCLSDYEVKITDC